MGIGRRALLMTGLRRQLERGICNRTVVVLRPWSFSAIMLWLVHSAVSESLTGLDDYVCEYCIVLII